MLAGPIALASVGQATMGFVDTAVVGRLGALPLGAVGLGNALFYAAMAFGTGVMMGLDPLISQAFGANEPERARGLFRQGIWLALGVTLMLAPLIGAMWVLLPRAGLSPALSTQTQRYLALRLPSLPAVFVFCAARAYLQAAGRTLALVVATVLANLLNLGADLLLVFGGAALPGWTGPLRALPALGAGGAAIATCLCSFLMAAVVAQAVGRVPSQAAERRWRLDRSALLRAAWVGLPVGLQLGAEVGVFSLVGFLAARLGAASLAAHQVAVSYSSISFCLTLGIGGAASVRVGRAVGAGDVAGARRAGGCALLAGASLMVTSAVLFLAAPSSLARLMSADAGVVALTVPLFSVIAVFQVSDGLQGIGAGILRGAGDTRFPFLLNLVGHYGVGLPVGVALGVLGAWGVVGLWWGLCAGLTAVAACLVYRFLVLTSRPIARL